MICDDHIQCINFSKYSYKQNCLAFFNPQQRNWFRISWLVTIHNCNRPSKPPMLSQNQVQVLYLHDVIIENRKNRKQNEDG
jgi:hypothetical protein